jgi:hypothetical protein
MIGRRRVGLLRRADAGSLPLGLSWAKSLSRRLIQRLGARRILRLVDHRPIQAGYGSGTRSLVWRAVRQPAMGGALPHLRRVTQRPPVDSITRSAAFAGESPVSQVQTPDKTEIRPFLAPVSDRDVAPVTPRAQRVSASTPARSGRRPMKQTAVELPVVPKAAAEDEDLPPVAGDSLPERPPDDALAPRRGETDADLHEHVRPEDVVAQLRPDRDHVPEPVDTAAAVSTEVEIPPPPSVSLPLTDEGKPDMSPSDAAVTAAPPVDAASIEGAGIPALRGPTEEVAEKPLGLSPGLSRRVPLVSPAPLPNVLRTAAGPGREKRAAPETPRRSLIQGRTGIADGLVERRSEVAPSLSTAVMRQPVSERVDVEIEQSLTPEESGPPEPDIVDGQAVGRGESDETGTMSLRSLPEAAGAQRTEEGTESLPRRPDSADMPVSSPPATITQPVAPTPGAKDRPTARPDYAPTASEGMLRAHLQAGVPVPLVSRERLTGERQAGSRDAPPGELLDPAQIWAAAAVRDLPLAGTADSGTVSPTPAGTAEIPEMAKAGRPGVRLERLLGLGADVQSGGGQSLSLSAVVQRAPAERAISRQEAAAPDGGGSEGAGATPTSQGTGGGTEPAGEDTALELDKMARQVYQILRRRLRVERERTRGWIG